MPEWLRRRRVHALTAALASASIAAGPVSGPKTDLRARGCGPSRTGVLPTWGPWGACRGKDGLRSRGQGRVTFSAPDGMQTQVRWRWRGGLEGRSRAAAPRAGPWGSQGPQWWRTATRSETRQAGAFLGANHASRIVFFSARRRWHRRARLDGAVGGLGLRLPGPEARARRGPISGVGKWAAPWWAVDRHALFPRQHTCVGR